MSAKEQVLEYLKQHLNDWVHNQDLRRVSGANDTPRIIRSLRQEGWQIEVRGDGYNRLLSLEKHLPKGERKLISRKLRFAVLHRDNYRCRACGRSVEDGVKLQVDHIIPIDWGGKTELDNLQALCEECNAGKKAWVSGYKAEQLKEIINQPTVESRIEALFEAFPNEEVPSELIQLVSKGALDWQRALRRIRQRTGKKILPIAGKRGYRYFKE
ncbi:MAG: HNH endonuclease [Armatimonadota bacterium]